MRLAFIILFFSMGGHIFPQADRYTIARNNMVQTQISDRGLRNSEILSAMRKVPRHLFVPKEYEADSYGDYPLPIGHGQTISQPYIVAYMTEAVHPDKTKTVLEVGTGSGYQAAILAELVKQVYTIEIIPELAKEAADRLRQLGYGNITCKTGDGYNGWPEHSPYDIIVVTAAPGEIPQPLIDQLAEGGRMIIPVGAPGAIQELILIVKKNSKIQKKRLTFVRFVPFRRL